MICSSVDSPIGELLLAGEVSSQLTHLSMQEGPRAEPVPVGWERRANAFGDVRRQLAEYFAGERTAFEVDLAPRGSAFQLRVWRELCAIPYGETISYGELARRVGPGTSPRAVGTANGRNPIAVIVPCHRVIGSDGSLTGYGGGLDRKRTLLDIEAGVLTTDALLS